MGTFNDKMTALADTFRSKFSITDSLTIDEMTTTLTDADIGGGFDFSAATAFTSSQLLAGQSGWDNSGTLVVGSMVDHGDVTVTLQETVQTLDGGYYSSITVPAAESGGGGDFDFSAATAFTSAQLLTGQKGWDNSGNLVTGTMINQGALNVTLSDQEQTFNDGYYSSITIPAAESGSTFEAPGDTGLYYSEKATLDGVAGQLVDFRYKDALIKTITTVADAEYIYPADNTSIMGTENYIHIPDITKLTSDVLKKGETILGVEGKYTSDATATAADIVKEKTAYVNGKKVTGTLEVSAGDNNIVYGVLDADGNFQALDLSGEKPVDSGTAESISTLVMYQTGHDEPAYPSGGGSSGSAFYECAVSPTTFINEAPVNPTQNQTAEYVITTSSEYDSNYGGYNAFSDTADQDKGWFCATGDDAPWVAIKFNEGFILESYSFAVSWDSREQTLSRWRLEGSSDGTSWNTIDERVTETLTSSSPTFRADIVNYSMYTHYRLSVENEYGHIGVQGWKLFSAQKTAGGTWSGYEMTQDADGGWLKSENLTEGLNVKGYNPMVGYIYNEDTTISVTSMYVASQEGVTQ